jgi:hypothetical protein
MLLQISKSTNGRKMDYIAISIAGRDGKNIKDKIDGN